MSDTEMTIEQARAKLGDLVIAAMNGQSTTITRYGRPAARIVPIEEPTMSNTVIWSVVRGESPAARAVEPGLADITIPRDVIDWAEEHGLSETDPDVYVLVAPADEPGEVPGEIAHRKGELSAAEVAEIRAALDA